MIAIGALMAIFAVYAGYSIVGLSLAFGWLDWTKASAWLAGCGFMLCLGIWSVLHNIRALSNDSRAERPTIHPE